MSMALLPMLGTLVFGQTDSGASGATWVAAIAAAVGLAVALASTARARTLAHQLAQLRAAGQKTQQTLKALENRERELGKKAEERQTDARELRQDLAILKKKHHTALEEAKALREQLRAQAEERDRLLASRPAFEPTTPRTDSKARSDSKPAAKPPKPETRPKVEDTPVPTTMAEGVGDAKPNGAHEARLEALETERSALLAALETERNTARLHKAELARLRHYSEQLRRIDMVSKGKVEVLEDKLAALGRQYYEVVSELAALKGEVVPPRPREESRRLGSQPRPRADSDRTEGDPAHETPEADALLAQMDAADAEALVAETDDPRGPAPDRSPGGPADTSA